MMTRSRHHGSDNLEILPKEGSISTSKSKWYLFCSDPITPQQIKPISYNKKEDKHQSRRTGGIHIFLSCSAGNFKELSRDRQDMLLLKDGVISVLSKDNDISIDLTDTVYDTPIEF